MQLVAVQMRWSLADYRDGASFAARVEGLLEQAKAKRESGIPRLVAFPEFVGLPLIFTDSSAQLEGCTRWREAGARLIAKHHQEVEEQCRLYGVSPIRGLLLARSESVRRIYTETFSRAAKRHHCYLVAGSAPLPLEASGNRKDGGVYNTSYFFGPDGALIGKQRKVHPYGAQGTPDGFDLSPGPVSGVRPFDTEFGKVGIAICYDAWQDDVMEALAKRKAKIVAQPSANAHVWDEWQQEDWKKGLWQRVQREPTFRYGVNPMMLGWLFAADDEYACDGQSAIVAATARSRDRSGYLTRAVAAEGGNDAKEQIVTATVDVD